MININNRLILINTNSKELKENLKKSIDVIYLDKGYRFKSEVLKKDILVWFDNLEDKDTLKHLHRVVKTQKVYSYGISIDKETKDLYNAKYGVGIMQQIILNWYYLTQIKK